MTTVKRGCALKYAGMLKIGFASTGVEKRVAEQFPVLKPGDRKPYRIVFAESAMYSDGGSFTDKRVHEKLVEMGCEQQYHQGKKTEGFKCSESAVRAAENEGPDSACPRKTRKTPIFDKKRPLVCFGSFQDFLGYNRETGGIKTTNGWVHEINWDLLCCFRPQFQPMPDLFHNNGCQWPTRVHVRGY